MNCSFVRGVMKNIGFEFLPDNLSNVDSKGLNYQDYEVSVCNHFTRVVLVEAQNVPPPEERRPCDASI